MKILLIGPMGGTDKMYFAPPLGIHRLRSYLDSHGFRVDAVDPTIQDIPDTDPYDIIGYSILAWSADNSLEHAANIRKREGQLIIVGGYEATFSYRSIFENNPCVDAAVLGEGEYALLELAQDPSRRTIKGIAWAPRDGEPEVLALGNSLSGPDFARVTLDTDYEGIPFPEYWKRNEAKIGPDFDPYETRTIRLYVKNRCGFKCDFCSSANFHSAATGETPAVLTIEPDDVAGLLVRLVKAFPEVRTFFFQDDEIFAPKTFITGLLKEIIGKPELEDIRYICQGRIDAIHPSLYPLMKDAGFQTLILGLENFSQNILSELALGKVVRYQEYSERIGTLLEWGLIPFVNIILSTPGAKLEDVLETTDRCLVEMERGVEIGMNLYTNNWAGSAMSQRKDYESEGFNLLPFDLRLRELLKKTDDIYNHFLEWGFENYETLKIKSSTRSLIFVLIMNLLLERKEPAERCWKLFAQWPLVPNLAANEQADAIRPGILDSLGSVSGLSGRSRAGEALMEVI